MKVAWSLPLLGLRTGKMVTMFPHRGSFSLILLSCVGQPDSGSLIQIRPRGPSEPSQALVLAGLAGVSLDSRNEPVPQGSGVRQDHNVRF
jgi:hypothetical protein